MGPRNNAKYAAANGSPIKNFGKREIQGLDSSYMPIKLEAQVADVSGALGSVYQICKAGNRICFDDSGGVIVNMQSGRVIPIKQNKGSYEMDIWMPADQSRDEAVKEVREEEEKEDEKEEEITMDFIRQGM